MVVLFERDLVEFMDADRPTKGIDPHEFKFFSELCADFDIIKKNDIFEASECVKKWVKKGKLRMEKVLHENALGQHRQLNRYHAEDFKELWFEDLKKYVRKAKKLVAGGLTAKDEIEKEFDELAIVGTRLKRVLRMAGMALEAGTYVRKHNGLTPIRKIQAHGKAQAWLPKELRNGPLLRNVIMDDATKRPKPNLTASSVEYASRRLEELPDGSWLACQRLHVFVGLEKSKGQPPIRYTFWGLPAIWYTSRGLPEEPMPTIDEAKRTVEQYRVTHPEQAKIKPSPAKPGATDHGESKNVPSPEIKSTGGRPLDPDVARRKKEMLEGWDLGKYKSKAAAARAHGFHRSDASKLIDEHEENKAKKA